MREKPTYEELEKRIRELEETQIALRESGDQYRKLIDFSPLPLLVTQEETIVFANSAAAKLFGTPSRQGIIGSSPRDWIHPDFVEIAYRRRFHAMETGEMLDPIELTILRKDGTEALVLSNSTPISHNGSPAVLSVFQDITDGKRADQMLRESERNYRDLFHNSHDAIFVHDAETGEIVDVNRTTCELFGYSLDELKTMSVGDFSLNKPPYTQNEALQWIHKAKSEGPQQFLWIAKSKDSNLLWFENSLIFAKIGNKDRVLVFGHNIDARIKAEKEMRRLLYAIEQAGEAIIITEHDGAIQYVNPAFEKVTGYSAEEVKGENPRILKSGKQGELFYRKLWDTITGGDTWQGRMVNKRKDGTLYTEEATISPVLDRQGEITNFVAVKRDITSELELENRLAQAQKMEAIGTLAGGIAHDFNNILSAILGFSELVEEELPEGSQARSDLEEVLKAAQRAKGLVKQILTFSRRGEQEARPLRMDLIVKETLQMLRSSLPSSIEVRHSIDRKVPQVVADPIQLHQIMLNLCTNAAQAMEKESGRLEVLLGTKEFGEETIVHTGKLPAGRYVSLCVSDTGGGMPIDFLERIFEPYFTTKKAGEGTGLGLAVVYGIVKDYGGGITVESELGKGSTFTLYLPAVEGAEPEEEAKARQSRLPWGRERILFVDDEPPIIKLGKEYLQRLGYDVTTMQDSMDALRLFRKDPDGFDLVITDMTMPKMTGDELATAILSIRPEMPIILCTGYSRRMSVQKAKEIGIRAFIMKPLAQQDLANTVREVLDEK